MNQPHPLIADALIVAPFLTQVVMLWLQVGAARRHRHFSFMVLSTATICGIGYLAIELGLRTRVVDVAALGMPIYYIAATLLVLQMLLGIWGTAALFQSYRELASAKTPSGSGVSGGA